MISDEEARKLKDRVMELEKENNRLKKVEKELEEIKKDFEETKKEFEKYKSKHTQTVEELRQALNIKPNIKSKLKPLGAQKGHAAYVRKIPERIDYVRTLTLKKCPLCKTKLGEKQAARSRYVTDVKITSAAKTTRYDISRYYCPCCKKLVEPEVPNVLPHAKFGLNLMLLVMYLRLGLRLPVDKIKSYFMDVHQLPVSKGEIICIMRQLVLAFGDYYGWLEKVVKFSRVKHTDTTLWRIDGKNYYAWVFVAFGVVLYKIRKHNNSKSAITVLGNKQKGMTLVIDRFSALRALAKKAGFYLQYCWAHILDDSKGLAKNFGAEGKYVHKKLKDIYEISSSFTHCGNEQMVEQFKAMVFKLTLRHYEHHTVRKFVNNLYYRDIEHLFLFVTDEYVDSTNNISERELRHLVIIRKISNGSRSACGANAMAMLLSIIQTLRFNKCNILKGLSGILNKHSF
jgi:hypothetical protein